MTTIKEFEEMGFAIIDINPGNEVVCDLCNEYYTNSDRKGGVLFNRTACCPDCASEMIKGAMKHHEERFLTYPNPDETFYQFILRIR